MGFPAQQQRKDDAFKTLCPQAPSQSHREVKGSDCLLTEDLNVKELQKADRGEALTNTAMTVLSEKSGLAGKRS